MALVRQVVGLGRAARTHKARIRVRQPLSALLVRVKSQAERERLRELSAQVLEELNVKRLEVVDDTSQLLSYSIKPNFRLLGPLFGPKLNAVVRALQHADAAVLARHHAAGEAVTVVVEGRQVEVPAEDFEVEVTDAPGFAVVEEGGYLVALDTRLTPELVEEGLVRELVHRLNSMRKDAGFRLEDRIVTYYQADERLSPLFEQYGDVIRQETLSLRLEPVSGPPTAAHAEEVRLDGHVVTLSVQRAESLV
jgi:isoleucyl-tRNA synthetase